MIVQPGLKRPRVAAVDGATGTLHYVAPLAREEDDRARLRTLRLWAHAGYTSAPAFVEKAQEGAPSSSSSSSGTNANSSDTAAAAAAAVTEARKRSLEGAHKAYVECAHLLALTEMINAQEHMTLLTCSRPGIADTRGVRLPPGQLVESRRRCFDHAAKIVHDGQTAAAAVIRERRLYNDGLVCLQKHWRLLSPPMVQEIKQRAKQQAAAATAAAASAAGDGGAPGAPQQRRPARPVASSMIDSQHQTTVYREVVCVDCSYVACGDSAAAGATIRPPARFLPPRALFTLVPPCLLSAALDPYLVPLERGPDGPALPEGERRRECKTLLLQVGTQPCVCDRVGVPT
jgi:hypothetical protein